MKLSAQSFAQSVSSRQINPSWKSKTSSSSPLGSSILGNARVVYKMAITLGCEDGKYTAVSLRRVQRPASHCCSSTGVGDASGCAVSCFAASSVVRVSSTKQALGIFIWVSVDVVLCID